MANSTSKKSAGTKAAKAPSKSSSKRAAAGKAASGKAKAAPAPKSPPAEPSTQTPRAVDETMDAAPAPPAAVHHEVPAATVEMTEAPPAQPVPVPQGEDWARQVLQARSAPIQVEEPAVMQVAKATDVESQPIHDEPAESIEPARTATHAVAAVPRGEVSIPEQFLTIAIDGQWDDRMERVQRGRMGAALAGSVLLELAVHGKVRVQRDHFVVEEGTTGDADLDHFAAQVAELGPIPTEQVVRRLGRRLTDRIRPWKQRAAARGWLREDRRKFLGVFPRSTTTILDEDVQGKLQNRLVRMLAGGGNPDVKSIALLGLLQAAGLLPQMVPSAALAFNEKRISLLLSGKDPLHYRMDTSTRQVQDLALRVILGDVRRLR